MSSIRERIAAEAAHYENDADVPVPADVVVTRPNLAKSVMLSVRLNPEEDAAIRAIAERAGVPVSTIVRGLIVRRIAADREGTEDRGAAFATAFDALHRLAAIDGIQMTGPARFYEPISLGHVGFNEEINA